MGRPPRDGVPLLPLGERRSRNKTHSLRNLKTTGSGACFTGCAFSRRAAALDPVGNPFPQRRVARGFGSGFLNREPQVRFLPGALSESPRSRHLSESLNSGSECAFRAVARIGPAADRAPTKITSTVGQDLDSGSCREVMPARASGESALRRSSRSGMSSRDVGVGGERLTIDTLEGTSIELKPEQHSYLWFRIISPDQRTAPLRRRTRPSRSRDPPRRLAELQEVSRPSPGVLIRIGASH